MNTPTYPIHPLCHLFPALPNDELYALVIALTVVPLMPKSASD